MSRQLPFEVYVTRKLSKWQARSEEARIRLVDAVGASPLEELIYFWNGHRRMRAEHLRRSLQSLSYVSESNENPKWQRMASDERAISAFLRAVSLRHLGELGQARDLLRAHILSHDPLSFKGDLRDSWVCPAAHYEMAVMAWNEWDGSSGDVGKVRQCREHLDTAMKFDKYDLQSRYVFSLHLP